ncbi:MAG: arylesterase [Gammaproteobacteria bacterium]|nr:arylesterase [Gammaproteobacteria bacterium]
MNKSYPFILCVLFLTYLVGCERQPELLPLSPDATILAFGDSLTFGTGTQPENSYPSVLEQITGLTVLNSGVPGDTTTDGVSRIKSALSANPDLVILCLGGNDFLRKRNKLTMSQNLQQIVDDIRNSGAQVMMIAVPKPAIFLDDSEVLVEFAEQNNIPILKDTLTDLLSDEQYKSDAIHLNTNGYRILAESINQFLIDQGAL